jgi:Rrf2 family transcriptional regulator, iron-sulfur cluster assembly transcription factor
MLSNTCKYALRALIYLGKHADEGKKIGIKKISEDLNISSPFLGKILQNLVKQKLLLSTKGPNGGFSLAKETDKISLWDIVTNVDGTDFFTNCLISLEPCVEYKPDGTVCPIHNQYDELRQHVSTFYQKTTLRDVSEDIKKYENIIRL